VLRPVVPTPRTVEFTPLLLAEPSDDSGWHAHETQRTSYPPWAIVATSVGRLATMPIIAPRGLLLTPQCRTSRYSR
jgi:hypothetical protein